MTTLPILYLSRYVVQSKADYYRLLLGVTRDEAWEDWILYMLKGVEQVSAWTCLKFAAVRSLMEQTARYVRARLPKQAVGREKLFVHPKLMRLMTHDSNEVRPYPSS